MISRANAQLKPMESEESNVSETRQQLRGFGKVLGEMDGFLRAQSRLNARCGGIVLIDVPHARLAEAALPQAASPAPA